MQKRDPGGVKIFEKEKEGRWNAKHKGTIKPKEAILCFSALLKYYESGSHSSIPLPLLNSTCCATDVHNTDNETMTVSNYLGFI